MKRLLTAAAITAFVATAGLSMPTTSAKAAQPDAVQYCKFLSQNGYIPNQGQCVSDAMQDTNSFCQRFAQYFDVSVGQCIHYIRQ